MRGANDESVGEVGRDNGSAHPGRPTSRALVVFGAGMAAMLAMATLAAAGSAAAPGAGTSAISAEVTPPGPPGFGVFYVNGVQRISNWSDNRNSGGTFPTTGLTTTYNQARVTYLRPENPTGPNIVLVPGYGLASDIYMTTPDLRQGWAQLLYAAGYPVYVVSPPDRGESMPVDQINKCLAGAAPDRDCRGTNKASYYGQVGRATLEDAWPTWRFGPKYGTPYPDSQFPSLPLKENYIQQFGASFVPYLGTSDVAMVDNVVMNELTADSLKALLNKIGPSIIVLHSAAGTAGFDVARTDPNMVKAVVAIETTKCPKDSPDGVSPLASMPFLGIWGDHITRKSPGGHWDRRQSCQQMAASITRTGRAPAEVVSLPDRGILGNSHMMMQDRNNEQVLGIITKWLTDHGL